MNPAHFHLVVNHFPIILSLVGVVLLLVGLLMKTEATKRVGYALLVASALFSVVAMQSGEGAEHVVEGAQIVDERFIEPHEEAAEVFAVLSYVLGALSLIGFWASWTKKSFANAILIAAVLVGGVTIFFAQQVGTTGGEIRHTEIRAGATSPASSYTDESHEGDPD